MFQNIAQNLTFNGAEARSMILTPAFDVPLIKAIMTLHEGIKAKQRVAFAERISKITVLDAGCNSTPGDAAITATEKLWDPNRVEMWVAECYTNLEDTYLAWGLANGYERPELDKAVAVVNVNGKDVEVNLWTGFVLDLLQTAALEDFLRIIWLGNEDITAGQLSATAKVKDYNQVDGFYKQIFAMPKQRKYHVTENDGLTYDAQELKPGAASVIFRNLLKRADPRLRNAPDKVYLMTRSIADNYQDEREAHELESSFELEADGTTQNRYRGVGLVEMEFVDRFLESDFNNGSRVDLPHRCVLTTLSNLAAGVDAEGAIQGFESHYEWVKKLMHLRGGYMVDALVMRDYLISAAY